MLTHPKTVFVVLNLAGGGAERVVVNLLPGLKEALRPGSLEVVQLQPGDDAYGAANHGVPIVRFDAPRLARAIPRLVGYLRKEKPDVVVSHLTAANIATALAIRLSGCGARQVSVAHLAYDDQVFENQRLARLRRLAAKWAYRRSAAVVAVSRGVAASIREWLGVERPDAMVVYNPIYRPEIEVEAEAAVDERRLPLGAGPLLVAAGRLSPQKDFTTLLEALALVRAKVPARLVILGEGPERETLEARAASLGLGTVVSMPGFLGKPYAYIARADLFVLSSVREGLPTVLIEALALGRPVVATDCPSGPSEILEGGRYGRLVPPKRPEALADAILEALGDSGRAEDRRARGRWFSVESAVKRYAEIIRDEIRRT